MEYLSCSQELVDFIATCPSSFHTVASIRRELDAAGFAYLRETDDWCLLPGHAYYTVRNGSSLIAFKVGEDLSCYHFQLCASHTDSPTYKLKSLPTLEGPDSYVRLNVEGYGGMIDYSWLDRPLSLAGRVMVASEGTIQSRLLYFDRDLLLIPSLSIHMNREVNAGYEFNRQVDLCPLFSAGELSSEDFAKLLADELGVLPEQLLSFDLTLVNRQRGSVWGAAREFVSAPRIDDLQCVFVTLKGFLASNNPHAVSVCAFIDSEEVGSGSRQGALSTFLRDTLVRLNAALGKDESAYLRALSQSILLSCDNAHALHPNHPEMADVRNRPQLNGGLVIKEHAGQLYATDAFGRAALLALCREAGVPTQTFANRSDKRGGSTLGNLSTRQVSLCSVDVGLAQLAMHSSYETAGSRDTAWGITATRAFYDADLRLDGSDSLTLA